MFRGCCLCFRGKYDDQLLADFFNYWSEEDGTGRMRWEQQRFWNLEKRLARWAKNQYSSDITAAALRLNKAKVRQQCEAAGRAADQRAAAERDRQQHERERQREADRRGAETTSEYVQRNPGGLLARMARERALKEQRQQKGGGAA